MYRNYVYFSLCWHVFIFLMKNNKYFMKNQRMDFTTAHTTDLSAASF